MGQTIPAAVCVASTDAHHHKHLAERTRTTWIRAERSTFDELKAALTFRHRVSLQRPETTHARILGLHVKGSFISEIWMPLNDGLNALIGGKGAGKTALIECIRFALNTPVPTERKELVGRHISHVLGSSGYVECLCIQSDGTELLVTRRADAPDRITVLDSRGELRTLSTNDEMTFPISILGWHEIEAVADQAEARISLLDRIGNAAEIKSLYEEIATYVDHARDLLPLLQRQIKKLEGSLRDMWELQRKRKTLQRLEQDELVSLQQQYEWFLSTEQKLVGLAAALKDRSPRLPELLASHISLGIDAPPESDRAKLLTAAIASIVDKINTNQAAEIAAVRTLQDNLDGVLTAVTETSNLLSSSFSSFRDEIYTPKVNALPPEDREILTRQIQVLEETKRLQLVERQCADLVTQVRSLASEIKGRCDAISSVRNDVIEKRRTLTAELNAELPGVRLTLLAFANRNSRVNFQKRYGDDGANLVGFMQAFGKHDSYENLAEAFLNLSNVQLEQDKWDVDKALLDVKFADMLDVIDDDDVEIALNVGKVGFVPIQNLSAGQPCVAVFPLLLRNSKGPLVIDQPEDNLDNRYIADIIAPDLLERKQRQQFLVTSHNANLVVLTDADLIIHVDSDGAHASFPEAGFLACASSSVRKSVLDVLDGGEAALTARQRKYGTKGGTEW
jgi:DNA repair ATPase RecN